MKNKYISIILAFLLLISCNSDNKETIRAEYSKKHIKKRINTIKIKIDSLQISSYNIFHNNIIDNIEHFVGYNSQNHSLDFFNLKNKKFSFSLKLEKQGVNKISNEVRSIWVQNYDSIFILQPYKISLIDTSGIISENITINNNNDNVDYSNYQLYADNNFGLFFKSNKLFLEKYSINSTEKLEFYTLNNEAFFNLDSKTLTDLEIEYPQIYKNKNYYYGYLIFPARAVNNELHVYSYPADPNIYTYNTSTSKYRKFGGKSKYQLNEIIKIPRKNKNSEELFRHMQETAYYGKLLYDKHRNLYYRFFKWALEAENNDGTFNSYGDKKASIIIFDNELNIIDEIKLPEHTYSESGSFVGKEGLYLSTAHYKNTNTSENILGFDVYKFEVYE